MKSGLICAFAVVATVLISTSMGAEPEFCLACEPFINDLQKYKDDDKNFVEKTRKACSKRFDNVHPTFCKTLVTAEIDGIQNKLKKGTAPTRICKGLRMC